MANKYYIKALILIGCPFGLKTEDLLKKHNIKHEIQYIESYQKKKYQTDSFKTFPQIYLKKIGNHGNLLLGGFDDLNNFIIEFKNIDYEENKINQFMNKYNNWSKKATLRLIQLINNIIL